MPKVPRVPPVSLKTAGIHTLFGGIQKKLSKFTTHNYRRDPNYRLVWYSVGKSVSGLSTKPKPVII